jgi:hypothetical protein
LKWKHDRRDFLELGIPSTRSASDFSHASPKSQNPMKTQMLATYLSCKPEKHDYESLFLSSSPSKEFAIERKQMFSFVSAF